MHNICSLCQTVGTLTTTTVRVNVIVKAHTSIFDFILQATF